MRSGRSALGVLAGVLLGLGVVALAGSGLNLYGAQAPSATRSPPLYAYTSLQSATTASTSRTQAPRSVFGVSSSTATAQNSSNLLGLPNSSSSFEAGMASLSQVNSIVRQPINLTGFALLPVLAAFLFGFVLYRMSKTRNEEEKITKHA